MCGLFGFTAMTENDSVHLATLAKVAVGVESRGPHAWGVAWVDSQGRIHHYKQPGSIKHYLGKLKVLLADARMVIGHTRWATHGHPSDNSTNHPHPSDGGWFVHNGQIEYAEEICHDFCLNPVSECDSELLGLIAAQESGAKWRRWSTALEYAQAYGHSRRAHAIAYLDKSCMVIARAGKPLYRALSKRGQYFSTTGVDLPRKYKREMFVDNTAYTLRYSKGVAKVEQKQIATETVTDGNLIY